MGGVAGCRDDTGAAFDAGGQQAVAVVSAVGSLQRLSLRFAGQNDPVALEGPFEITALSGTIDPRHQHLHVTVADGAGRCLGGHLPPSGAEVFTTVELVLLALPDLAFSRQPCAASGYPELSIRRITGP